MFDMGTGDFEREVTAPTEHYRVQLTYAMNHELIDAWVTWSKNGKPLAIAQIECGPFDSAEDVRRLCTAYVRDRQIVHRE